MMDKTLPSAELRRRIDGLPRRRLAHLPTPLEDCPRLSKALGGPRILVKRDDLTGPGLGGNKIRALEFIVAEAQAQGADTLIAVGRGGQSDSARQVAAAAARAGLKCILVLRPGVKGPMMQGNLLLDQVLGAEVRLVEPRTATAGLQPVVEEIVGKLKQEGRNPYLVQSETLNAVAYVECALEIGEQLAELNTQADYIFVASRGGTQAGLVVAGRALEASFEVVGVSPERGLIDRRRRIADLAGEAGRRLDLDLNFAPDDITNLDDYVGVAYGMPTRAGMEALGLAGQTEGLVLDPVYTSKALAALIDYIRKERIRADQTVVFVHTGGIPALFAYSLEVSDALREQGSRNKEQGR